MAKERGWPDYRLVIVLVFLALVALHIAVPGVIAGVPIVGPYMQAMQTLYQTGGDLISGNIGISTIPMFMLAFVLVVVPPLLIALAIYIYKAARGFVKFVVPIAIIIIIIFIVWKLIGEFL